MSDGCCMIHGVFRSDDGCPACGPDLTTLEREVVEKAEEIRRLNLHILPYGGLVARTLEQIVEFNDAVDALQSARTPKGVKPSEVEPLMRVRFCNPHNGNVSDDAAVYMLARDEDGYTWAISMDDGRAFRPDSDSAVLPLDPQEPE